LERRRNFYRENQRDKLGYHLMQHLQWNYQSDNTIEEEWFGNNPSRAIFRYPQREEPKFHKNFATVAVWRVHTASIGFSKIRTRYTLHYIAERSIFSNAI
jgi:hypothetical protein